MRLEIGIITVLAFWFGGSLVWIRELTRERDSAEWQANHWRTGYYQLCQMRAEFYSRVIESVKRGSNQNWWN